VRIFGKLKKFRQIRDFLRILNTEVTNSLCVDLCLSGHRSLFQYDLCNGIRVLTQDSRLTIDHHLFASNAGRDEKEEKARSCVEMKDYKEATKRTMQPKWFFEEPSALDTELSAFDQFRADYFYRIMAPCGLRNCKNWLAPFPGRMSYKATKPGLVSVLYLSMLYTVLLFIRAPFIVSFRCYMFCRLVVLAKLSVSYLPSDWLERLLWRSLIVARGSSPECPGIRMHMIFLVSRARRGHQKRCHSFFSIQRIVFPTGCTEKLGLIHRRAVSPQ